MKRRTFLQQCGAMSTLSLSSTLLNLHTMNALAATPSDYKALVCIFLFGGNDSFNMVVPTGADYADYARARGPIAIQQNQLLPFQRLNGREFGLNPHLSALAPLFNDGKLALLANVGTLLFPVTREQYRSKSASLPPQLFSHSDQQVQWQTGIPDSPNRIGWGGRVADLLQSQNNNPNMPMCVSLGGNQIFLIGNQTVGMTVNDSGTSSLSGMTGNSGAARYELLNRLTQMSYPTPIMNSFVGVRRRALETTEQISNALAAAPSLTTTFPDSGLGRQLNTVARLISSADSLNVRRQVFFCTKGGWDTHAGQPANHPGLLQDLGDCMASFYAATQELGISEKITTFTASDFGRTWNINGDGTDHGWGGHQWILGGAVRVGVAGVMPTLTVEGPDDAGRGRFIPTTPVDSYIATLARWFGVSESDLPLIVPNLSRFSGTDLGFLG